MRGSYFTSAGLAGDSTQREKPIFVVCLSLCSEAALDPELCRVMGLARHHWGFISYPCQCLLLSFGKPLLCHFGGSQ